MGRHSPLAKPYPTSPPAEPYPFAVGDAVLVDGVAPGRVRGVHPSSSEVSVRLDEDNNLHRMRLDRVELYTWVQVQGSIVPGISPAFE